MTNIVKGEHFRKGAVWYVTYYLNISIIQTHVNDTIRLHFLGGILILIHIVKLLIWHIFLPMVYHGKSTKQLEGICSWDYKSSEQTLAWLCIPPWLTPWNHIFQLRKISHSKCKDIKLILRLKGFILTIWPYTWGPAVVIDYMWLF